MNILVVRFSSFGDILQSLPALTALHRRFPDATMTYPTQPAFAALVENHPGVNSVRPLDGRGRLRDLWRLAHALNAQHFTTSTMLITIFAP